MDNTSAPLLVLIGFMGAGKTTVGRMLASRLGCEFIDLDAEIARVHGPIPDLFSNRGESGFRAIEHHQLNELLPSLPRPSVFALGGGAYLQPANRELLEHHRATVIFLDANFEAVHERIANTGHQRPLAQDLSRLRQLYEQRRPVYLTAHHTFDASSHDPSVLLRSLLKLAASLGLPTPPRGTL